MQPKEFFFSLAATAMRAGVPPTVWTTGPATAESSVIILETLIHYS